MFWINDDEDAVVVSSGNVTVYEEEDSPLFTGILDHNGAPIYAVTERDPIGFDLRKKTD